jgi:hypothetical protein
MTRDTRVDIDWRLQFLISISYHKLLVLTSSKQIQLEQCHGKYLHRKWNDSTTLRRVPARDVDACFMVFTV